MAKKKGDTCKKPIWREASGPLTKWRANLHRCRTPADANKRGNSRNISPPESWIRWIGTETCHVKNLPLNHRVLSLVRRFVVRELTLRFLAVHTILRSGLPPVVSLASESSKRCHKARFSNPIKEVNE